MTTSATRGEQRHRMPTKRRASDAATSGSSKKVNVYARIAPKQRRKLKESILRMLMESSSSSLLNEKMTTCATQTDGKAFPDASEEEEGDDVVFL